jgi:hypothetical protein
MQGAWRLKVPLLSMLVYSRCDGQQESKQCAALLHVALGQLPASSLPACQRLCRPAIGAKAVHCAPNIVLYAQQVVPQL